MDIEHPVNCDNLIERLTEQLLTASTAAHALLSTLCHLAESRQSELYVVGGLVRDLLMDKHVDANSPLDLDFAVDDDPSEFHVSLSEAAGRKVTVHDRFGTASVTLADGTNVDLARTRSEHYPSPAALPQVLPAPIDIDLQRRDFTINAAALGLTGARAGKLIDPQGAVRDLKSRSIRTLHRHSFRDDPTRLIRAARYAARIEGTIEPRTIADARRERDHLQALSPARFGDAWRLLLQEPAPSKALAFARRLRIPQAREPRWHVPKRTLNTFGDPEQFWASNGLLCREPQVTEWLPESVAMNRRERSALEAGSQLRAKRRRIGQMRRSSSVALILKRFPDHVLLAASRAWSGPSQAAVSNFLERRDEVVSPFGAERLVELGVEHGPQLGHWLERVESAIWDGILDPSDPSSVARMEQRIRLSR